jgi:hypothetical protein
VPRALDAERARERAAVASVSSSVLLGVGIAVCWTDSSAAAVVMKAVEERRRAASVLVVIVGFFRCEASPRS